MIPIIFSGASIRAILAGAKVQTRRLNTRWDKCKVGDRLWVREAWTSGYGDVWGTIFRADNAFVRNKRQHERGPHFSATNPPPWIKWRSCLFLPCWASRITLELTAPVKVEELHDISFEDIAAEGVLWPDEPDWGSMDMKEKNAHLASFAEHWDSINPGVPWASNPDVRVLTFRMVS